MHKIQPARDFGNRIRRRRRADARLADLPACRGFYAPSPLVGRYQLENAGTNEPYLVDTVTGETYSADTSLRLWFWKKVAEPVR